MSDNPTLFEGNADGATRRENSGGGTDQGNRPTQRGVPGPSGGPTRRELPGDGDAATRRESVGSATSPSGGRFRLPEAVAARYDFVSDLAVASGEADIAELREKKTGRRVAFKYYRHGIIPDLLAMEKLRNADKRYVVELISFHSGAEGAWEIQEFCAHGALSQWVRGRGGRLDPATLESVVRNLAAALSYLHGPGSEIAHRDLKPANVLVRSEAPLVLVLADFGLAKAHQGVTNLTTTIKGSWHYAAPEVYSGVSTTKSDWFALGVMLYEFCTGRRLFAMDDGSPVSDADARARCLAGNYSTDRVDAPRWKLLCDGLLTWDREHRWGAAEVNDWLRGRSPAVYAHTAPAPATNPRGVGYRPSWSPVLVSTTAELAEQLRLHWDAAATELAGRPDARMISFLEGVVGMKDAVRVISSSEPPGAKLVRLQGILDPEGAITYEGVALDSASLARRIEAGGQGDAKALDWLAAVLNERILTAYAEVTGSQRAAQADYLLSKWKEQAVEVAKPLPSPYQVLAREAFRAALPELFAAALSRSGGQGD